jgi:CheY-like chemotaxis protein
MINQITTLIVDDEQIARREIKEILTRRGFKCRLAGSEDAVVRIIEDGFYPETAIIDNLIPSGSHEYLDGQSYGVTGGLRLCRYILEQTNGLCRVIILSGLDSYREASQLAGAWGYCEKPIIEGFFDFLNDGLLKPDEIGKPTINIRSEISNRNMGKERF